MKFNKESLLKLGKLAKLSIKDDKLESLSADLSSIVKFIDRLQEINTEEIEPTSNSLDQNLILREDIAININTSDEVLENAPEKDLNFYSVPKVIE
jgi:aspartyl-tRNA(Asn)/glutamyl-tRNA(Gln) amidotransferase subunit C